MMYGVENEFRVKNNEVGLITNLGDGSPQYNVVNVLRRLLEDANIQGVQVVPELDAQQGEIIIDSSDSLEFISDKLANTLLLIESKLSEYGAKLDDNVGVPKESENIVSTQVYPELVNPENFKKYEGIDNKLKSLGVREHTNIIGMHLNISHNDRKQAIEKNIAIGRFIRENLKDGNYAGLFMSNARFESYTRVTNALGIDYLPLVNREKLFGVDGKPTDTYAFNRLRQYPNGNFGSELRFPDAITSSEDVHRVLEGVYELYK